MKKVLRVWTEREGYSVDENTTFEVASQVKAVIKKLDKPYEAIKFSLERIITLKEYQNGFIDKYRSELKDLLTRFLQMYAIKNELELVIGSDEIHSNEQELSKLFGSYCEKHKFRNLEKPSASVAPSVLKKMEAQKLVNLSKQQSLDFTIISAIDWYNTGKIQRHSTNTFLHFFIPLELLSQKFVSGTSWKKENKEKYEEIISFLNNKLKDKKFKHKLVGLESFLPRFVFREQVERYFTSLFTKEELDGFWEDDSDVTFNGKHAWKQYKLISRQKGGREKVKPFRVLKHLYDIRNDIVHNGLKRVASKDIFILENILRRVLKKELIKIN
jgi:hypothetical protein